MVEKTCGVPAGFRQCPALDQTVQRGFTLIELTAVVILLGVVSIFVAPRAFNSHDFNARGFHDETLSFLRYAQKTAIAQRRTVCLSFTANSVALAIASTPASSDCAIALIGPMGQSPALIDARPGAVYDPQPLDFRFNGLGQPIDSLGSAVPTQTLHVAGTSRTIVVESATGYVHE